MKNLFLLAVLAAATISAQQPELPAGHLLVDVLDDVGDKLIADGVAREATAAEVAKASATAAPPKAKTVKVRVLTACEWGVANDVAHIPAAALKDAQASGVVDSDKAAVAYAESLAKGTE